eukprot:CAMPEP_0177651228 /NCGR_PEP_ID=MMETSP0447-20121125/12418_1 /TAXON_ID=0 /ORGANISM="Stygamoeba regulata, Strain BSH-02190019" /LENGTH=323 /DNA_ID=CAMNT_0019154259 /DNA_START=31 /DNA_END=999 /DNA_ORIENTATION=+
MAQAINDLTGTDGEKLAQLCAKTYKEQAVWFLNAFFTKYESEGENLWNFVAKMVDIDIEKREAGSSLNELEMHRFLEAFNETMTVLAMRSKLRETGAITDRPKNVPLTHYLLFKYGVDWKVLVNAPQGDNQAAIDEAQAKLDAVLAAYEDCRAKAQVARDREADAHAAEAPFKAAQEELEAALAEMKAQEDAYNNKTAQLKQQSEEGGVVSRNRAKVQLDAHLAEDPLPLRRAKLTTEAARKKAEKARAPFEAATQIAVAARAEADAAVEEAARLVADAEAFLEEVRNRPGSAKGTFWWMDRELTEIKKYKPTSRGGIAKYFT